MKSQQIANQLSAQLDSYEAITVDYNEFFGYTPQTDDVYDFCDVDKWLEVCSSDNTFDSWLEFADCLTLDEMLSAY